MFQPDESFDIQVFDGGEFGFFVPLMGDILIR
jgi:hypothetical protein